MKKLGFGSRSTGSDGMLSALGALGKMVSKLVTYGDVFRNFSSLSGGTSPENFARSKNIYGSLAWSGIAVNRIVKDCSSRDFVFVDNDGDEIDESRLPAIIQSIFYDLNYGLRFDEIMAAVIGELKLTGNAFILLDTGTALGKVSGVDKLAVIPSKDVTPYIESGKFGVSYYDVSHNGIVGRYPPEKIVHFRETNIRNPYIGTSPGFAIDSFASMLESINDASVDYATSGGLPRMILRYSNLKMAKGEVERMRELLKAQFDTGKAAGKNVMLPADEVITSSFKPTEVEFIKLQEYESRVSLAAYGVPQSVVGIPSSNYATAEIERVLYLENTCNSLLRLLEKTINTSILRRFVGGDIKIRFSKYNTADDKRVIDMLMSGVITYDRAAELLDQPLDYTRDVYVDEPSSAQEDTGLN